MRLRHTNNDQVASLHDANASYRPYFRIDQMYNNEMGVVVLPALKRGTVVRRIGNVYCVLGGKRDEHLHVGDAVLKDVYIRLAVDGDEFLVEHNQDEEQQCES